MARKTDYGIWDDPRKPQAKRRADGKWECVAKASAKYPMPNGGIKRFKRIADTKEEAEVEAWTARNKYERAQRLGLDDKESKNKTLKQYMEEHMKERLTKPIKIGNRTYKPLSASTYKIQTQILNFTFYKSKFANLQLSSISLPQVVNYLTYTAKERDPSSLRNTVSCLNTLFADLYRKGLIDENYMTEAVLDITPKNAFTTGKVKKETLTDEDIQKLYAAFKEDRGRYRYYAAYILLIETGMRQGELFALKLQNIDKENGIITIDSSVAERYTQEWLETGQGKKFERYEKELKGREKSRLLKLSKYAIEAIDKLERQLEHLCRYNPHGLLLPQYKDGYYMSSSSFEAAWKRDCERLGIERPRGFGPHKTRHTGTTVMETRTLENNPESVRQMVGHKSVGVHQGYTHQQLVAIRSIQTPMEILEHEHDKEEKADKNEELRNLQLKILELEAQIKKLQEES